VSRRVWIAQVVFLLAAVLVVLQLFNGKGTTHVTLNLDGREQTVFSWTRDRCEAADFPDAPARAFRNAEGQVVLISSQFVTRRAVGADLDHVRHQCPTVMSSAQDPDPAKFDDREWLTAPYTLDGRTVYALVHEEYEGYTHPGACASKDHLKCWFNSVTLAVSHDGGAVFSHAAPPPADLVASIPYRYVPNAGFYGVFQPSNIVRRDDGYFYSLVRVEKYGDQQAGSCLIRTRRLDDPRSWRAWDGAGFTVSFVDPYSEPPPPPGGHICRPVSPSEIEGMTDSLTFNTYLDKFILVSATLDHDPATGRTAWGFYFSLSKDLTNWTHRKLFKEVELLQSYRCGDSNPVYYPSLLDPASRSRNFETTGRRPYLYFVRYHYANCKITLNRDLVRVPIKIDR
jgi:hypothetical protein